MGLVYFVAGTELRTVANVKKGQLTAPPEWWKHLRWAKRVFWKRERRAGRKVARKEAAET